MSRNTPGSWHSIDDTGTDARPLRHSSVGKVTILRFVAAQDVGKAIHPPYVEGQIQGGVAQGIGWALNEEYIYDRQGRLDNAGLLDYRVPVTSDMPMIEAVMVEVPNPAHPYGGLCTIIDF